MTEDYTAGPWYLIHTPPYLAGGQPDTITIGSDAHTEEIATVWSYLLPTRANAWLIAAAPDLLAVVEALRDELESGGKAPDLATIHAFILPKVLAAITKARGAHDASS